MSMEVTPALKLWPPAAGEVRITVDPSTSGAAFAAGTQTLRPGAEIPLQQHLDRDVALFIHKGQGRASLNGQSLIVNPGAMWSVPRGTWYGLRNPGNGELQLAWVASPGMEAWFRELSRAGAARSAEALHELAQCHRVEFQQKAEVPGPIEPHRHGRRGGPRHRGERAGASGPGPRPPIVEREAPAAGISPAPSAVPQTSAAPQAPHGPGRRRRRRGGGGGQRPPAASRESRPPSGRAPAAPPQASAPGSARPGPGRQRPARGRYQRRGKEVFMGGKWVRVEGEGPAIAPSARGKKRGDDDEPRVRLSVQL